MRFSERHGLAPVRAAVQIDGMDAALRNGVWTCIHLTYFGDRDAMLLRSATDLYELAFKLYFRHLKRPADDLPYQVGHFAQELKSLILKVEWYEVYDLVEAITLLYPDGGRNARARALLNDVFEQEHGGFRFVGDRLAQLSSAEEIAAVETALVDAEPMAGVRHHLERAIDLMSSRTEPDFPNSIKESISAVEAMCQVLTAKRKATLGQGLKALADAGVDLHKSLVAGFQALYGFTNDSGGIRHAAEESPSIGLADATYFLVSCSAFITYLLAKAVEGNIVLFGVGDEATE